MPLRKMQAEYSPSLSATYYISPSNSPIFADASYYFTGTPSPSPLISSSPVFSSTMISSNTSDTVMFPKVYLIYVFLPIGLCMLGMVIYMNHLHTKYIKLKAKKPITTNNPYRSV